MKRLLPFIIVFIFGVTLLLYLNSLPNFLPTIGDERFNWLNISVVGITFLSTIFSFISLITYLFIHLLKKDLNGRVVLFNAVKISSIFTFGITIVLVLNFFHVLNLVWGLGVLFLVLLISIVI